MVTASVIIPVYNGSLYILEAVKSVLSQTYTDYEIIVVDDGSTDDTRLLLEKFGDKLRYIYQQNQGPSAARNNGIKASKGRYIAFLDADDIWLETKLERQIVLLEENETLGITSCGTVLVDANSNEFPRAKGDLAFDKDCVRQELIIRNVIGSPSSVIVRKECFEKVGLFDESLRGGEDKDMWFRTVEHFAVSILEECLVKYRVHNSNAHKNIEMMRNNQRAILRKHRCQINWKQRLKANSYIHLDAAHEYSSILQKINALQDAFYAILWYPLKTYRGDDKYQVLLKALFPSALIGMFRTFRNKVKSA
jgi:glycosyltransferase involved in cell wall biosynthesis